MKHRRIPLYDITIDQKTIARVVATLKSGWLSSGPVVVEFENRMKTELGCRNLVAVSSATVGLEIVLRALGVTSGCEVITSPFTFVATAEVILRLGGKPVFADIHPKTLTIDPSDVAKKITEKTKLILPVDLAGHPSDYRTLRSLARRHEIPIVSDASHSLGAHYQGKSIGQLVDAAVYSLQATKNLTTVEGGMVVCKSKKLAEMVRLASRHGMSRNAHQRKLAKSWRYDVDMLGIKGNLPDLLAAVGLGQLAHFKSRQKKRRQIAERYVRNLSEQDDLCALPTEEKLCEHSWHLFIVKLQLKRLTISRDRIIELMSDKGIECGLHYPPIVELSYYKSLGYSSKHTPMAALAGEQVLSLPLYPDLKLTDVDYVSECMAQILTENSK